jgi:hypothetical protein
MNVLEAARLLLALVDELSATQTPYNLAKLQQAIAPARDAINAAEASPPEWKPWAGVTKGGVVCLAARVLLRNGRAYHWLAKVDSKDLTHDGSEGDIVGYAPLCLVSMKAADAPFSAGEEVFSPHETRGGDRGPPARSSPGVAEG